ncbi:hypothetical protein [Archangium primigenium]|uniref:hypothetical protein n=1 Tax=[Archangium] primigenium TaxID=2792470 RepID=UPI0019565945|nr:hypothetical protein [Archangium primigenium]MBM7116704.1 hypothetical protein [Archangium primigenium]
MARRRMGRALAVLTREGQPQSWALARSSLGHDVGPDAQRSLGEARTTEAHA